MENSFSNKLLDKVLDFPNKLFRPFRIYLKAKHIVEAEGVVGVEKNLEAKTKEFKTLYKTYLYKQTVGDTNDLWLYKKRIHLIEEEIEVLLSAIKFAEHRRLKKIKSEMVEQYKEIV